MSQQHLTFSSRLHQFLLITSTLLVSWLGMMIVHEFGHVIAGVLSGGKIQRVVLHPLAFSRTDLSINPHPLLVAWGGPVLGCLLPLLAFVAAALLKMPGAYLLRFFAGFCLVANGGYIGIGSFNQVGDTYPMLLFGSQKWQLWLFGTAAFLLGLYLWHRLGPAFGLGPSGKPVSPVAAYVMLGILLAIISAELLIRPA